MIDFRAIVFKYNTDQRDREREKRGERQKKELAALSAGCQVIQPQVRASGVYKIKTKALRGSFMWHGGWKGHITLRAGRDS